MSIGRDLGKEDVFGKDLKKKKDLGSRLKGGVPFQKDLKKLPRDVL